MAEPDKWVVLTAIAGSMAAIAALFGIPVAYRSWRDSVRAARLKLQREAISLELELVVKSIMPPIVKDIVDEKLSKSNADNEVKRSDRNKVYINEIKSIHQTNRNLAEHIIKVKDNILGPDGLLVKQSILETKLEAIAENCTFHKKTGA